MKPFMIGLLRQKIVGLNDDQLRMLLKPPQAVGLKQCWMTFIMTFLRTGNIYDAAIALLDCLMGSGVSSQTVLLLQGAQQIIRQIQVSGSERSRPQEEFFLCVFNLVIAIFSGMPIPAALYAFLICLIGDGDGPEPPPPPSGEVPDYHPNPVSRCV